MGEGGGIAGVALGWVVGGGGGGEGERRAGGEVSRLYNSKVWRPIQTVPQENCE